MLTRSRSLREQYSPSRRQDGAHAQKAGRRGTALQYYDSHPLENSYDR